MRCALVAAPSDAYEGINNAYITTSYCAPSFCRRRLLTELRTDGGGCSSAVQVRLPAAFFTASKQRSNVLPGCAEFHQALQRLILLQPACHKTVGWGELAKSTQLTAFNTHLHKVLC